MKAWATFLITIILLTILGCAPISEVEAEPMQPDSTVETEAIPENTLEPIATATPAPTVKPTQTPFPTRESVRPDPDFFTFIGTNSEGDDFALESLRGKPFMILFFSVHCGHCHNEAGHLEELYQTYQDQGFSIVAFEASGANSDAIRDFAETYGLTFPVLSENNQSFAFQMGVSGVPANFFINEDGEIVNKVIGYREGDELKNAIESLLANE